MTRIGVTIDQSVCLPKSDDGETWVVGAVILNGAGRIFLQRRSPNRQLFPGCWNIVGGHVELGETLIAALQREVIEETGWRLKRIHRQLGIFDWSTPDGQSRREVDFLVEVEGDLELPALEWHKHTEYAWINSDDLVNIRRECPVDDDLTYRVVAEALSLITP